MPRYIFEVENFIPHIGHKIAIVPFGQDKPRTIAIMCEDCSQILLEDERYPDPYYGDDPCEGRN